MSGDRNNQQPSIPESAQLGVEHLWLAMSGLAFTIAAVALIVEHYTAVHVLRGGYSLLTGLFVSGCVGWVVGSAERRVRRDHAAWTRQLREGQVEVRDALTALRQEVARTDSRVATDAWWQGYATALEDQAENLPRRVLPFRMPRGDTSGDSKRPVNGSE